jgi:4-carboxymuconolactone decarboxylase
MEIGARDPERMTPAQRAAHDAIAAGPRGAVPRPFLAMLDDPALCVAIAAVGADLRYHGALPDRQREIAICAAAVACGSGYEWSEHEALAAAQGITRDERAALLSGRPDGLPDADAAIAAFVTGAVRTRRADRDRLDRIVAAFGREAATEVTAIAGYYPLLALFLSAAALDTPLPDRPA